ncbi:MAG: hypothetical protein WB382_22515, partial [Pseudolabrys sp.]
RRCAKIELVKERGAHHTLNLGRGLDPRIRDEMQRVNPYCSDCWNSFMDCTRTLACPGSALTRRYTENFA